MAVIIRNCSTRLFLHFAMLCVFGMCIVVSGQDGPLPVPGEAILVDEFSRVGDCEFSGRIDTFFAELSNNPDQHGYIINYKSVNELPGDKQNSVRERTITNHIALRNFDRARITLIGGGYREEMSTELWRVLRGGKAPEPSRTLPEPQTPQGTTFLYAKRHLYSDYEEDILQEFVLQSVKDQEEADRIALEAESEAANEAGSDASADTDSTAEAAAEQETDVTDVAAEDSADPIVDERTAEEKEDERFSWANVGIARLLAERKTGRGVIIFYADDQRYDIGKLAAFMEQGRDRLAEHGPIKVKHLRVEFGGYRHQPEVEFWFVPAKGKTPRSAPDERSVQEPDAN